ncbi:MAG: D-tagatose-1,6-bisphosphate aldolase subunit GatY [Candidatus Hydrogenedentes bacterium ADurb.Bin101]|nr:MAG: D-tagatose-1,6-bisphosphate aldolase subunit GatY [Candidatus Hydrogenedentes bacterium ADurb.Bin101]HOC68690.1 class II fructose-bisphosphate aldolase [Candidatus Hydrogenedentota bacterium]
MVPHLMKLQKLMLRAAANHTAIPGFNIPYLPMMVPVVNALRDTRCFGLIMVARLEWTKFAAGGLRQIFDAYQAVKDERYTRLHLDHVPVIDEDQLPVEYDTILREAVEIGYDSVMVDGSRLSFSENIAATRAIVDMAHASNVPVEAELGAVLGHESGPLPPYEEVFATGCGFTDPDQARIFVKETGVDWLSVAVGSVHGAIAAATRREKKLEARLSIERLDQIRNVVGIPLVLHGGTGIRKACVLDGIQHGIAKINVATAIRQPYEALMDSEPERALEAVYRATRDVIEKDLELSNTADLIHIGDTQDCF